MVSKRKTTVSVGESLKKLTQRMEVVEYAITELEKEMVQLQDMVFIDHEAEEEEEVEEYNYYVIVFNGMFFAGKDKKKGNFWVRHSSNAARYTSITEAETAMDQYDLNDAFIEGVSS